MARRRRTAEERIAALDEKIAAKEAQIEALEAEKEKILHPARRRRVRRAPRRVAFMPPKDDVEDPLTGI